MDDATKLLEDRIAFKFYAADYYLTHLKGLESKGITFRGPANARAEWELITENLLFHLVGAVDALLVRIKKKFELEIKPYELTIKNVYERFESIQDLLKEAYELLYKDGKRLDTGWLYELTEMRNRVTHRAIINFNFSATTNQVSFDGFPDINLEPIPYLEGAIQKVKDLITTIIKKEPLLSNP